MNSEPGVIEVKVSDIHELFHSLDPSPFPNKDLDRDAEEFIVGWAREFPKRVPLEIRVHLPQAVDEELHARIEEAIHNYFAYRSGVTGRRFAQMIGRGWLTLGIGLLFLAICLGGADMARRMGDGPIFQIAQQSFVIAGWVAMAQPMSIFLYDWWPIRRERNIFARLSRAKVQLLQSK